MWFQVPSEPKPESGALSFHQMLESLISWKVFAYTIAHSDFTADCTKHLILEYIREKY